MNELITITYQCVYCGEGNETVIDPSGGNRQSYTENCTVCCRPNVLHISITPEGDVTVSTEFEG